MKKLIFALSSAGTNGVMIIEKNLVTNHMEANRKSITVKDHVGREVNPYSPYDPIHEPNSDLSRFDYFAKHNVAYPCPELANTKPGEMVQAELVWQYQTENGWHYCDNEPLHDFKRQIYRLVPKEEKADTTPYELIANERRRKSEKYGWDDKAIIERVEDYGDNELAWAAAAYCLTGQYSIDGVKMDEALFPWDLSYFKPTPNDRIKELVKAGAFIIDEIIRLQAFHSPPTH